MAKPRYKVRLTRGAEDDLEALHAYVSEHRSRQEAEALPDSIVSKIETREQFPDRGERT